MSDTLERVIRKESSDSKIEVMRRRCSDGTRLIMLAVGKRRIYFSSAEFGDNYEQAALEAADMLDDIANNPCLLQKSSDHA